MLFKGQKKSHLIISGIFIKFASSNNLLNLHLADCKKYNRQMILSIRNYDYIHEIKQLKN